MKWVDACYFIGKNRLIVWFITKANCMRHTIHFVTLMISNGLATHVHIYHILIGQLKSLYIKSLIISRLNPIPIAKGTKPLFLISYHLLGIISRVALTMLCVTHTWPLNKVAYFTTTKGFSFAFFIRLGNIRFYAKKCCRCVLRFAYRHLIPDPPPISRLPLFPLLCFPLFVLSCYLVNKTLNSLPVSTTRKKFIFFLEKSILFLRETKPRHSEHA